jgi:hypothetical protein
MLLLAIFHFRDERTGTRRFQLPGCIRDAGGEILCE